MSVSPVHFVHILARTETLFLILLNLIIKATAIITATRSILRLLQP